MRLPNKRPGTYHVKTPTSDRPYDPALDGWNVHKLRRPDKVGVVRSF